MTPPQFALLAALAGLLIGALLAWLLLRSGARFAKQASEALGGQKAQLDAQALQIAAFAQQLGSVGQALPAELGRVRESLLSALGQQRQDFGSSLSLSQQGIAQQTAAIAQSLSAAFEAFGQQLTALTAHSQTQAEQLRNSLAGNLTALNTDARSGREETATQQKVFREGMVSELKQLSEASVLRLNELRAAVETRLKELQTDNAAKLEAMRQTVDEKLHATLEARLGESFKQVSDRLEQVHRGLGEMQQLATGVGDLKRVLTNVKTRGGWGEVQLGSLLEQLLTVDQFASQFAIRPGSSDRVDYAIRLPGKTGSSEQPVWIPIDAKFPVEDYQRLMDAHERADLVAIESAAQALENAVRRQARSISEKYICPPHSTDFALLFLPTEGLYAEVLRRPGLADAIQRDYRVIVTGPTTISALLNSLQMGFRSLAVEQRSSEVWQVLGAVKTEFSKFGEVLGKVQDKLDQASDTIKKAGVRSRAIQRNLRDVEALPESAAQALLGKAGDDPEAID